MLTWFADWRKAVAKRIPWVIVALTYLAFVCWAYVRSAVGQIAPGSEDTAPDEIHLRVDEVRILFHAADSHGLTVSDLKPEELELFDEEKGPGHILAIQPLATQPLSLGFLIDVSESMASYAGRNRLLASLLAQKLLTGPDDSAVVISFGKLSQVIQPWSNQQKIVLAAFEQVIGSGRNVAKQDTAIYDALFNTCHYEFGEQGTASKQHVLLLFSDGEDTASYVSLRDAVDACQAVHTVVYAVAPKPASGAISTGPIALMELTEGTGGRVIQADESEIERKSEIQRLINDLRHEYELFYRPKDLKHDGAFHRIVLLGPNRVSSIDAQSGYYAPAR
jgi:Ca-activated chloride channel family protein